MKVLNSIRYLVGIQTFFCIAPYCIRGGRVITSAFTTIWCIVVGCGFLLVVWYSAQTSLAAHPINMHFQNGYLWGIIAMFELTFTNVAYPALVAHAFVTRRQQMRFLNQIATMDEELESELGVSAGLMNQRLRLAVMSFMFVTFVYFNTLWFGLIIQLGTMRHTFDFGVLMFLICNQMEQFVMGLLTWSMVTHMMLLRCRFKLLRQVHLPVQYKKGLELVDVRAIRIRMVRSLSVYKRLVVLMDDFSRIMGNVMLLRFAHDFTLLVSQMYIVYYILSVYEPNHFQSIVFVVLWSLQNVVKILVTALAAHLTVLEVRCAVTDWSGGTVFISN